MHNVVKRANERPGISGCSPPKSGSYGLNYTTAAEIIPNLSLNGLVILCQILTY